MSPVIAYILLAASEAHSWDYFKGGDDWIGLCASGRSQSPIDLKDDEVEEISRENNMVSITFNIEPYMDMYEHSSFGGFIAYHNFGGIKYNSKELTVKNVHYHAPSEHTINGDLLDLEVHFFTADDSGQGYGFGVLFKVGDNENEFVQASIDSFKYQEDETFNTTWVIPNGLADNFYYYNGSITNPSNGDCSEIIVWTVFSDIFEISQEQLDFFNVMWKNNDTFAGGNGSNRNVQDLNGRTVYYYDDKDTESFGYRMALGFIMILALA